MEVDFEQAEKVAVAAVERAAAVCQRLQAGIRALEKEDRSPVTVADFASQAVVAALLEEGGISLPLVGEETTAELGDRDAMARVVAVVGRALGRDLGEQEVAELIDRGRASPPAEGPWWTIDPIDGTKGFLRGEQYAVALALLEGRTVELAILAAPNLVWEGKTGVLLVARRGAGTRRITPFGSVPAAVSPVESPGEARFCESVEKAHSRHSAAARIADRLGIETPPRRLDSQAKYAALALGEAEIYLRLPRGEYREKIWDHAAGMLVVEEAGGRVTDLAGLDLDFGHGRQLAANRGIVATNGRFHDEVVSAVSAVLDAPSDP